MEALCADDGGRWGDRDGDGVITASDRRVDGSTGVIEAAHAAGLLVHIYTFQDDAGKYGFKDPASEIEAYLRRGADGVFTDFTATGVARALVRARVWCNPAVHGGLGGGRLFLPQQAPQFMIAPWRGGAAGGPACPRSA